MLIPIDRNFETAPVQSANQMVGSLRESAFNRQSSSKLSAEGPHSDFTFVLSNPTTEQNSRV